MEPIVSEENKEDSTELSHSDKAAEISTESDKNSPVTG